MAHSADTDTSPSHIVSSALSAGLARTVSDFYVRFGKRGLDILLVLLLASVALPLVALLALMVRRDGGPAFFGQVRVGRDGAPFTCWKLRSMAPDAEHRLAALLAADPASEAEWRRHQKLLNDPRITPVGRLLRKTSLDELPQLWNVLVGDMSLVGPRPMTPDQQALYPGTDYYRLRPGLTGPWQVSDRHASAFADRAAYDAAYARDLSLGGDLGLLARTAGVVLRCRGA